MKHSCQQAASTGLSQLNYLLRNNVFTDAMLNEREGHQIG